jgi:hypothetical protein
MVVKSRKMSWAGHVARMGAMRNAYDILVVKPEWKRNHSEDLSADSRMILEWIFGK